MGGDSHEHELKKAFFITKVFTLFSPFFLEARVEDFVSISVDEAHFSPSAAKMKSMLGEANLKSHGFEEEEITRKRNDKNGDEFLSKTLFYFKVVSCSQASQTIQELKNLLPGKYFPFVYLTCLLYTSPSPRDA